MENANTYEQSTNLASQVMGMLNQREKKQLMFFISEDLKSPLSYSLGVFSYLQNDAGIRINPETAPADALKQIREYLK